MTGLPELPVTHALPQLADALRGQGKAVLVAPPGAGKTTLVPLLLLQEVPGRIILVEPRRLAARAAARRIADLLGEKPGETVGHAMRFDTLSSERTRILVVTDGVFSRMALDDPALEGIDAVLFDEFHERSLDVDLGLALALDIREALRPELKLVVMSATLDTAPVARLLGEAPVVESPGRSFPVELRYRPREPEERIEDAMAAVIGTALQQEEGSILAFLPGRAEIRRTGERLTKRLPANADLFALHGDLDGTTQDQAIRPAACGRRKVVLATSIAESSITIDGVRVVVDSGLTRLPRHDAAAGVTRLETVRVSRAAAEQRAGRAGRTAPGIAWRLWHKGQDAALAAAPPPAILTSDLSGFLLDCAAFGIDPARLCLLDSPPAIALHEAEQLLRSLGALAEDGRLTQTGTAMRRLPLPPRLSAMILKSAEGGAARLAAEVAMLLVERGLGGQDADLERRLARFRADRGPRARAARAMARRLAELAGQRHEDETISAGLVLARTFPDRIAQARETSGRFRLANGRGARLDETDPLAAEPWLVVADLTGTAANARILAAAPIQLDEIETLMADRIETEAQISFDHESLGLRRRGRRRLGALVLGEAMLPPPAGAEADAAMIEAIRMHGLDLLPWTEASRALLARLGWLQCSLGAPWPDVNEAALLQDAENWLLPFLPGRPEIAAMPGKQIEAALRALLPYPLQGQLDEIAPPFFAAPTGSRVPIRYDGDVPAVGIRVQELYGLDVHPAIAGGRQPLLLELLSPAGRPVQLTQDLPGFWRGSWKEVRTEMRGRYPKHFWPEHPETAVPTTRARPKPV